jgi:hypothetical protein
VSTSGTRYRSLPYESEAVLKAGFVLVLLALGKTPASADQSTDLVVGSVRDQRGAPISGAEVAALNDRGMPAGHDRTDPLGTFAVALAQPARSLEIRCRHCRTARIALTKATENLAIVIVRYAALEGDVPDARDLAALPYGATVDALRLIPFTVVSGSSISDRGLGAGKGLILDDGAPFADSGVGVSALEDFPNRYARTLQVSGPERAFQYGINAGGGIFAVDQMSGGQMFGSLDAGGAPSLALMPSLGSFYPAAGESNDDGIVARRADIDFSGPFAGGSLRAGYGAGAEDVASPTVDGARDFSATRASYATASKEYRTFADFSASDVAYAQDRGTLDYRSSYENADFRIEHPGLVTLSAGANVNRQSNVYGYGPPYAYAVDGRTSAETGYVEAQAGDERTSVDAGLGLTDVATHVALVPSISTRTALGGGTYARIGFSEAVQVPAAAGTSALELSPLAPPYERSELEEGAIGFDDGARVRAEATVYCDFTQGSDQRRLDGVGAAIVWQIAPLLSLRVWSLRASPLDFATPSETQSAASRQVLWSTYENGDGLRLDAIARRDASSAARGALEFDGDALVPIRTHVAIDIGSAERLRARRYSIGLRLRS